MSTHSTSRTKGISKKAHASSPETWTQVEGQVSLLVTDVFLGELLSTAERLTLHLVEGADAAFKPMWKAVATFANLSATSPFGWRRRIRRW